MPQSVLLSVPASLAYRDLAGRTVAAVCKLCWTAYLGPRDREGLRAFANELISAVGEAFNNVVVHAYAARTDGQVDLQLTWNSLQVQVEIRDSGAPFDFDGVPNLDLSTQHEAGMGIHIIRSFVDVADYRPGPPNVLVLLKRLPSADEH